jgi:hypothetical protein
MCDLVFGLLASAQNEKNRAGTPQKIVVSPKFKFLAPNRTPTRNLPNNPDDRVLSCLSVRIIGVVAAAKATSRSRHGIDREGTCRYSVQVCLNILYL